MAMGTLVRVGETFGGTGPPAARAPVGASAITASAARQKRADRHMSERPSLLALASLPLSPSLQPPLSRPRSRHGDVDCPSMSVTTRLAELVAFDTQNPAGRERPMVDALARELAALGASQLRVVDVGAHAMVYARFGTEPPRLLVNAHVDTVPANAGYTRSPLEAVERDGRLYGLGSSDTKGAIAAVLEALAMARAAGSTPRGLGVLFSGDEERSGTCLRHFLAEPSLAQGLTQAIVCEPARNVHVRV